MASSAIIIPARLRSARLPGKLLLPAGSAGKPILQYTYEAACRSSLADIVAVAVSADSPEIAAEVARFGGRMIETAADQPTGTHRVAEAARQLASDGPLRKRLNERSIVINWQADEPEVNPAAVDAMIRQLASLLASESSLATPRDCGRMMQAAGQPRIWTLAAPFPPASQPQDWSDPNIVKIAVAGGGRAMYFSRSPFLGAKHHVGIYGFAFDALMEVPGLPPSWLAQAENLEQLQWLEAGKKIGVVLTPRAVGGINTRYDYEAFCRRANESGESSKSSSPSKPSSSGELSR